MCAWKNLSCKGGSIVSNDAQKQVYDNVLKRLIEGQFAQILPLLFSTLGLTVLQELTIEALLPPRRMDRVYLIRTLVGEAILHLEIEMSPRGREFTGRRILVYHSLLLEKWNLPVITIVLYPFDVPAGKPELVEKYGDEEILRFSYRELSLKTLDAPTFVQARPIPLYGLLPAMANVSLAILLEAIEDMVQYFAGDDDRLRDELLCFLVLLNRAKPLPEAEMEQVLRRIHMYDPILEEDPWVQEYGGRQKTEGKAEGLRRSIEKIIRRRFPDLKELALERVSSIRNPDALDEVEDALLAAQDELHALRYLQALPGNQ
jgi:hypothetical protein